MSSITHEPAEAEEGDAVDGGDEGDLDVSKEKPTLSLQKNDRSLSEFHRWYGRGRLLVDPEWQRHYVWDRKRASRLIESILIDLPIPVIYLAVNSEGNYEVIDGLQRLTSVFDFFDNKYELSGLEILVELNGKTFSDLNQERQTKLEDSTLRTFELAKTAPKDLMFIIFERLNTGGMKLNDMEIRNCLYRGGLNTLLKALASDTNFLACVNLSNLEKRMDDRMLVLRFLAFYQLTYTKAKKGLKAFFNEFCETYRNPSADKMKEFERAFRLSMRACYTIFGDRGFRLRRQKGASGVGGEWTPRVNASIFQCIAVPFTNYDTGALTRRADGIFESYIDLVASDELWVDCVTSSTGTAEKIEYAFETWSHRLREIMKDEIPDDTVRTFSHALKEELFSQNSACKICGQRIVLINDAALDHIKEYWRGGQTVPENARLVHRLCNLKRKSG